MNEELKKEAREHLNGIIHNDEIKIEDVPAHFLSLISAMIDYATLAERKRCAEIARKEEEKMRIESERSQLSKSKITAFQYFHHSANLASNIATTIEKGETV